MTSECKNVGLVLASSLLTLGILTAKCQTTNIPRTSVCI